MKNFASAISQIAEEKGIPKERVFEIIEQAYAAAYKKDYGQKGQIIKAKLKPETGDVKFWQIKQIVTEDMIYSEEELEKLKNKAPLQKPGNKDEESAFASAEASADEDAKVRFNPEKHIMLADAKKISAKAKAGEELEIALKARDDYGRIAAQTAKQVILQRIKEVEREVAMSEFKEKEGEIISGIVQRMEAGNVYFDIGKTLGFLPKEEQIPREFYRPGQRLKLYILKVEETAKGPLIFLSRAYPKIISKLFEIEAPEVAQGLVQIKAIAREPGFRSKIAVASTDEKIDPIGSVVGQRGTRVSAVINELGGEKIDIIKYAEKPEEFIANSLAPAQVVEVKIGAKNKAFCLVPEDQLSLAIGKEGQNVRLAAKLTGWKIDVEAVKAGAQPSPEATAGEKAEPKKAKKEDGK